MSSFAILTSTGRNKEAAALATGVALNIVSLAWGDGDRIPAGGETSLLNELGRKPVQAQGVVSGSSNAAFFDILLDENEGPYVIREAGLFDVDGDLIAIAKYDPVVNKPLDTVSALLRINIVFTDLENLVLQVNSTNAFAPAERQINTGIGLIGGGDLSENRELSADIATQAEAEAGASNIKLVTPLRLAQAIIAASADFTTQSDIDAAINALIGGSPAALDTLNELAAALADDADFAASITAALAGKLGVTETAADAAKLGGELPSAFVPLVDFTIQTGFGARDASPPAAIQDWNDVAHTRSGWSKYLLYGHYANGPGPAVFYHIMNAEYFYRTGAGGVCQMAIPYLNHATSTLANSIYYRNRTGGIWGPWRRILTDQDTGPDYEAYLDSWTQATATTFVHGLGAIPSLVTVMWVCKVANNGWSVGDECPAHYGSGSNYGVSVGRNASALTVGIRGTNVMNAAATASFIIDASTNWAVKVRAWK